MRHDVASILIIDLAGNFLGQKTHSVYLVCVLRYSRLHPQQLGQKTSKLPVQTTDIFRVEKSLCFRRKNLGSDKTRCKPTDVAMQRTWMYIYIYACLWIYHTSFQVTDLLPCISPTAKTQPQRIVEFYVLRWTALRLNHSQKQEELMFHKKQLLHQHWSCKQHSNNSDNFRLSRSITALSQATKSKWIFETV